MKKLVYVILIGLLGCSKGENRKSGENTVEIINNGKTYNVPITVQNLKSSGTNEVFIQASSSEMFLWIEAASFTSISGIGDYFLHCCNNKFQEKFSGGTTYEGVEGGSINNWSSQKGNLKITRKDEKGFSGSFSVTGKNPLNVEKTITGIFNVNY